MALTTDSSTNNFQLTAFGNTLVVAGSGNPPFGGGSAYFDGTGDYLELPLDPAFDFGSDNFTIECWFYSIVSGFQTLVARWGSGGNAFFLGFDTNSSNVQLYINGTAAVIAGSLQVNQWNHIAAVRDGSNIKLFLNGTQVGSTYNIGNTAINSTTEKLRVGDDNNGGNPGTTGYIDDLRITKGIARYTTNFTPPTQQLFDPSDPYIDNVSLLLHMDNLSGSQTFIDSSNNNFTLSAFGNTQISTSTKKFGNGSGYFDGSGDYLKANWDSAFTFGTGDFTVEFWAYPTGTPNGIGFITAEYNPGSIGNVAWAFGAASSLGSASGSQLFFGSYEGGWTGVQSVSSLTLSAWSHVAASRSSGTLRLFLSGVNIAQDTFTNNISTGDPLIIGRRWDYNEASKFFNGYIDELRVTKGVARYTTNFVPQTAPFVNLPIFPSGYLAFWKLADTTDSSPNGNDLFNTNDVQFVAGKIGNCAQFNGTGKSLNLTTFSSSFNSASPYTISLWYNITTLKNYFSLIGCSDGDTLNIHGFASGDLAINNSAAGDVSVLNFFTTGSWNHLVVTRNSSDQIAVWRNGVKVQESTSTGTYGDVPFINIGNVDTSGTSFAMDGKIDAVGIWQRTLTQTEIQTLYNNYDGREP